MNAAYLLVPLAALVSIGCARAENVTRESLVLFASMRDVLDLPRPELSADEAAQLDRLIAAMPRFEGDSGRFDHADLEPILDTVEEELQREVSAEIVRQASARVEPGSFGESLRRRAVAAHLERHGEEYLKQGMEVARNQVRDGLGEFYRETGTASAAPEGTRMRDLTLAELKQFGHDARVLQVIARRSAGRGMPRFTFPNGMSTDDLKAIRNGEPPPSGQIVPR